MLQRPVYAYEPTRRLFAMAVEGQNVCVWDLDDVEGDDNEGIGGVTTDRGTVVGLAMTEGRTLVAVYENGLVVGWDVDDVIEQDSTPSWEVETELLVGDVAERKATAEARRHLLGIGAEDGEVVVLELGTGSDRPEFERIDQAHADKVEVLEFSSDGRQLATAARDREIAIWSVESKSQGLDIENRCRLTGSGGWPLALAFADDGRRLAAGCMDNGVYLWNPGADEPLEDVRFEHHGWVEDVRWAGDDVLVSASWDNSVGVYDVGPLKPKFQFMYHDDYVVRVLPVVDSSYVFAASYDGEVTVWDWEQGRLEAILEGHSDWVTDLIQVDEETVASLSSDRTARLWSIDDGSCVAVLGEPVLEGFELGGGFDPNEFGLDLGPRRLEDDAGVDLDELQSRVVRRFGDEGADDATVGQNTAISMLEEAVEPAEDLDVDDVEQLEADGTESSGLGDELSDLVRDAISDVEEEEVDIEKMEPADGEGLDDAPTQQLDPEAFDRPVDDDAAFAGESMSDEGSDPVDMLDVPEMETAEGSELGTGDASSSDVVDDSDIEVSTSDAGEATEDDPGVDELAESAFEDFEEGVSIMDSVFETPMEATGGDEETGEGQKNNGSDGPESPEEDEGLGDEDSLPTSGPSYDPQPVGPDDDVGEFLPDDEELELAFSSSVVDIDDEVDEPVDDEEPEEQKKRDVDRESDGDDSDEASDADDAEGSSGKVKPPSADELRGGRAGGGTQNEWRAGGGPKTSPRGKPLPAAAGEATLDAASSVGDVASGSSSGEEPAPNETMSPFTDSASPQPTAAKAPEEDSADDETGNRTMTPFTDASDTAGEATSDTDEASESDDEKSGLSLDRNAVEKLSRRLQKERASRKTSQDEPEDDAADESDPFEFDFSALGTSDESSPAPSPADEEESLGVEPDAATAVDGPDGGQRPGRKKCRTTAAAGRPHPSRQRDEAGSEDESESSSAPGVEATLRPSSQQPGRKRRKTTHSGGRPRPGRDETSSSTPSDGGFDHRPETDEIDAESVAQVDRQGREGDESPSSQAHPRFRNQTRRGSVDAGGSGREDEPEEPPTRELKLGDGIGTISVDDEDESPEDGPDSPKGLESHGGAASMEDTGRRRRLIPGEHIDRNELNVPDPERTVASDESETGRQEAEPVAGEDIDEVSFEELWQQGIASAPAMGILCRKETGQREYRPRHRLETGHAGSLALALSSERHRLMTAGEGGVVRIWNDDGEIVRQVAVEKREWVELGFITGERFFYGLGQAGSIDLWLIPEGEDGDESPMGRATVEKQGVTYRCGRLDDDEAALLIGTEEGTAYLWDLEENRCTARLDGHDGPVSAVAFGQKGPITADPETGIRFWNRGGLQIDQVETRGAVQGLAVSGDQLMWVEKSGALRVLESGGSRPLRLRGHFGEATTVDVLDDGRWVTGGEDGRILICETGSEEPVQEIQVPAPVFRIAAAGRRIAAASAGGSVFVFEQG